MLGPFRMWNYLPGMSSEEAAGIVARAIVQRPRTISPLWARIGGSMYQLAQAPVESALAGHARRANPDSRRRTQPHHCPRRAHRPRWPPRRHDSPPSPCAGLITIASIRVLRPIRPDRLARVLLAQRRFGGSIAFAAAAAAELHGDRPALIDERGTLTFAELDREARRLAGALHSHFDLAASRPDRDHVPQPSRVRTGDRGAPGVSAATSCRSTPTSPARSSPTCSPASGSAAVVYDEEFEPVFDAAGFEGTRIIAWHDSRGRPPDDRRR